jgi:hypothetical protein
LEEWEEIGTMYALPEEEEDGKRNAQSVRQKLKREAHQSEEEE